MATNYTTIIHVSGGDTSRIAEVLMERRERVVRAIPDAVDALVADGLSRKEAVSAVAIERSGAMPDLEGSSAVAERHFRESPILIALMVDETRGDAEVLLACLRFPEGEDARWGMPASPHAAEDLWGVHRETRSSELVVDLGQGIVQMRISTPRSAPMKAVEAFAKEFADAKVIGGWYDENFQDLAAFYSGADGTGIVDLEPSQFAEWFPRRGDHDEVEEEDSDADLVLQLLANAYGLEEYEKANPGYVRLLQR
jgi:hypothetical protein